VIEWIESERPSISPICQSLSRIGFDIESEKFCFSPSGDNRDLAASLTCLAAIRFGDCQRSSINQKFGVDEGLNSDEGAIRV
jgi:hypothetical protein